MACARIAGLKLCFFVFFLHVKILQRLEYGPVLVVGDTLALGGNDQASSFLICATCHARTKKIWLEIPHLHLLVHLKARNYSSILLTAFRSLPHLPTNSSRSTTSSFHKPLHNGRTTPSSERRRHQTQRRSIHPTRSPIHRSINHPPRRLRLRLSSSPSRLPNLRP